MSSEVIVHKGRTNTIIVDMGIDISADTITSQIRSEPTLEAPLIAEWVVDFLTDGVDGKLVLTLDNVTTGQITESRGYMDLNRVSGTEPLPVFDRPLEVSFRGTVTA